MPNAAGRPPLPNGSRAQQGGSTRSLNLTISVCLASLAALAALSVGRWPFTATPLRLSSPAVEPSLDHYATALRRGQPTAAQSLQESSYDVRAAPDAAALTARPSIAALANAMTARALAVFAAAPGRVQQLVPELSLPTPSEPARLAEAADLADATVAANGTTSLGIEDPANTAEVNAPQSEVALGPRNASEAAAIRDSSVPHNSASSEASSPKQLGDMAEASVLQEGASLLGQPSEPKATAPKLVSQAPSVADQHSQQPGASVALGGQVLSPEDLQSALEAAAFAEDVVASQAAFGEAANMPTTTGSR